MQSLSGGAGALIEFLGRYVRELGGGNDKDKSEAQGGGGRAPVTLSKCAHPRDVFRRV